MGDVPALHHLSADGPSNPIRCLLAFDHDGCGRWVGETGGNGEPPKALATLVQLLETHIGPAGSVEYKLASYSNRQSEAINELMKSDVSGAKPHVELADSEKGRINLLWLSRRIEIALKDKRLPVKAVHEEFFLKAEMDKMFAMWEQEPGGVSKKRFKDWCQSDKKGELREAIRQQFPGWKIVYLDDHCLNRPTDDERKQHTEEVENLRPTGVVEWNDCNN